MTVIDTGTSMRREAAVPAAVSVAPSTPRTRAIWIVILVFLAFDVVASIVLLDRNPITDRPLPWFVLLLMFVFFERLAFDIPVGPLVHAMNLSDVVVVMGVFLARPIDLVSAQAVAVVLVWGGYRRIDPIRLAFNLAQAAACTALTIIIVRQFDLALWVSPRAIVATMIASLVVAMVAVGSVNLVIQLAGGRSSLNDVWRTTTLTTLNAVVVTAIGLQAVQLSTSSWGLVLLLVVPVALVTIAARSYLNERRKAERIDFVHKVSVAFQVSRKLDDGLATLLGHVREGMRADFSRVLVFAPEGVLTSLCSSDGSITPVEVADEAMQDAGRELLQVVTRTMRFDRRSVDGRGPLAVMGLNDAIVAPLFRSSERSGLLIAANRQGNMDTFKVDDLSSLELIANQLSVALERGWLEESLNHLMKLEQRLSHEATHDGLTGLANRRLFNEKLNELFERNRTQPAAVMLIDLDDFKLINDSYGHQAGDRLLAAIGDRLAGAARAGDTVARIGGDEFAMLIPGLRDHKTAAGRSADVIDALATPIFVDDRPIAVRLSIGTALIADGASTSDELMRKADLALYHAKDMGKDRFAMFESAMQDRVDERRQLSNDLRVAIERNELEILFQPIHDLVSGRIIGAEALMRWHHPTRGLLTPDQFLHLGGSSEFMSKLGSWVLNESLAHSSVWMADRRMRNFCINVNVSASEIHEGLVGTVEKALLKWNVAPQDLVLEITESALIEDLARSRRVLDALVELGVRVALDDFGTGYSSLSYIHSLPLHKLKIDRSFVTDVTTNEKDRMLVGSIIHLANMLGITAVAEGIETEAQLTELRLQGCRYGQGFLMSMPQSAAEFTELLDARTVAFLS